MTNDQLILVPQGAEYKAVCRGLSRVASLNTTVIPIPVGVKALGAYLHKLQQDGRLLNQPQARVLVMGLCGSLSPSYPVGKIVLYENCVYQGNMRECNSTFTAQLYSALNTQNLAPNLVKGLTSDRVVCSAAEKRQLAAMSGTDVVDMEGFAALEFFSVMGVSVAMLRVVSDDCQHDIPDITSAISPDGSLKPLPLALTLLRQPIAATRLIRGSLQALKTLEEVTALLFSS
ncbi:5'-methylthioadenosine/S-adenosylhomocysteine nucleosidase family protein [Calothrix sp. NIES-2098]|uniref:5'-methylthioadenosine/S-adenosylhomocysteine nucleosidase family protein n=1 Tax=Calothrix sp. NIES-2098 TaxID=1954171 RepID=UPI000B607334|nr:hypothetical protein NIES2098_01170 [Calothrix sp. NIES-2098]